MRTADLAFDLPPELIAQTPLPSRDDARLMVVPRMGGPVRHRRVRDLPELLSAGDLLVANNSRVLPARLIGRKAATGAKAELLLLHQVDDGSWSALARPVRRMAPGTELIFASHRDGLPDRAATVEAIDGGGQIRVRLSSGLEAHLGDYGTVPLPPYIRERLDDSERYQTIFADQAGSAAAPTAGLHVTPELLGNLETGGIGWAEVTLHVGLDTFKPISADLVEDHRIHQEWCAVGEEVARRIQECRARRGRVIALGTTSARTLETLGAAYPDGNLRGWSGRTDLFITPGYEWRVVDGLLTNFHLPRSSLLALVSALIGWERLRDAYAQAIEERYRFFSFGDAMLIL